MYTSYFANVKKLPADLEPVSIARGTPPWAGKIRRELRLAPTQEMLKFMTAAQYDRAYAAILKALDPAEIARDLGDKAVLLCWEAANVKFCHRRVAAEWLESELGIVVPEYGFERKQTLSWKKLRKL